MATYSGIPKWTQVSKQKIQRTDEWMSFTKELFDNVSKPLLENGIRTFHTLPQEEQKLLVLDAVEVMKTKPAYANLLEVVNSTLDQELSAEANAAVAKKHHSLSKLDFISLECENAVEAILNKWPETKVHMRQCLGVFLSPKLRYLLWKVQLENDKAKKDYQKAVLSGDKKRLVSEIDFEISQKSQSLLISDSTLGPLQVIKAAQSVMRHLLSYYHRGSTDRTGLTDTEYLLAVPFVYCTLSAFFTKDDKVPQQKQVLNTEALAVLASQYSMFLRKRPEYMTTSQAGRSFNAFATEVKHILTKTDPVLVNKLEVLVLRQHKSEPNVKSRSFVEVVFPWLRTLLVGYLSLETVMYIWDQMMVGYGVENFDPLPSFCALFILIARDSLVESSNWKELESKLRSSLKNLTRNDIRGGMIQYKLNSRLSGVLEKAGTEKRLYPVSQTSTLNNLPPWREWYSAKLSKYLRSNQQKKLEQLPLGPLLEDDKDDISLGSFQGETVEELRNERDNLVEELHLMRAELADARQDLSEEKLAKAELQEVADEQIDRLRRQIELARRRAAPTEPFSARDFDLTEPEYTESDTSSVISAPLPTPPASSKLKVAKSPEHGPKAPSRSPSHRGYTEVDGAVESAPEDKEEDVNKEEEEALDVLRSIVGRVMSGANAMAHGVGEEQERLNAKTATDMKNIRRAFDQAKMDVLGKPMTDDELTSLPEKERMKITLVLNEATKKRLQRLKLV
uniref:Uncharacterized protein LOC100176769 n=1 Tax=Phallusia mammillata TaxID=59560 RepID=A0A6F9DH93_9ASCI|nr:uncharacterized protein LOC100176769 [Phallusia mammillata]